MAKLDEFFICACIIVSFLTLSTAINTIAANQTIKDGESIVSAGNDFELGFFSLNNSSNRYLGIWSNKIDTRTFVWVPNKETPFSNTSGEFKLDTDGRLLLLRDGDTVWSSNFSYRSSVNPVAQLLDTGNFVVRDLFSPDVDNIIWQSNTFYDGCGSCGLNSACVNNSLACSCLTGFEPRQPERWNLGDWSGGCLRHRSLDCVRGGYQKTSGLKLPDSQLSWYNLSMTHGECVLACDTDCSCAAYASPDNGSGCSLWFGDLENMIRVNPGGQELYVKMTKLKGAESESSRSKVFKVVVSIAVSLTVVALILALYAWSKKRRSFMLKKGKLVQALNEDYTNESQKEPADVPSFSLSKIVMSTNNFSINNKLGQGGFGPVYKGVLEGREIAVKRLSKTSSQGFDEFKNEVRCIAQLQHRNLVKLLGYCIQGVEIMLIYEYMPNKSLDSFIFDELKSLMLDWPRRFHIIHGIARGLLYLHQDSRLRVIHRDLKAGNILLDLDLNPKISDFGLARRFRGHESEANTNKVVGTLGYISPEYASNGLFSVKSDVFSFGVLLLEIVSGKKNRGFSHVEHNDNLLGHAWRLYRAGKSLELISEPLRDSCVDFEVIRAIHIGLLCVQDLAEDRPTMSLVVSMLDNDGLLPPPNQPAFFSEKSPVVMSSIPSTVSSVSVNNVTITVLDAR